MNAIRKYPRTPHVEGSRLQPGDEDAGQVPLARLRGRFLVVEEKLDGANSAISFDAAGQLRLQSRGHFLTGGPREKHFHLFKRWAAAHASAFRDVLGSRYVLYGEWLYAKHTIFYDRLPHYFHEFDVLDTETGDFLSTASRRALLAGLPLQPVPVLHEGPLGSPEDLPSLVGPSRYKSPAWRERLTEECERQGLDAERAWRETDGSDLMEGLYLKDEEGGRVVARYKYVRASFLTSVLDSGGHWLKRPVLPNRLADGVDLFSGLA